MITFHTKTNINISINGGNHRPPEGQGRIYITRRQLRSGGGIGGGGGTSVLAINGAGKFSLLVTKNILVAS